MIDNNVVWKMNKYEWKDVLDTISSDYYQFVFIVREGGNGDLVVNIAYLVKGWGKDDGCLFQVPETVGDSEGLSVSYFDIDDILFWTEIPYPEVKNYHEHKCLADFTAINETRARLGLSPIV